MFHRGGGSTRLLRRIDFKRNVLMTGFVERIEYDPNRSARIALIRWSSSDKARAQLQGAKCKRLSLPSVDPAVVTETTHGRPKGGRPTEVAIGALRSLLLTSKEVAEGSTKETSGPTFGEATVDNTGSNSSALFTYILASDQLKVGDNVMNLHLNSCVPQTEGASVSSTVLQTSAAENLWEHEKLYQQVGNCIPLCNIPIGTFIHNIELHPGQGGKLVRAAGTFAQLVQKLPSLLPAPSSRLRCIVRLPSGLSKPFDSRCRATIGIVSNPAHSTRKLTKAGQRRWLGKRPIVRGVAMNPIDHPHGGGEGRTKGGRPSVSPWGKPTKGGFKTVIRKHKK